MCASSPFRTRPPAAGSTACTSRDLPSGMTPIASSDGKARATPDTLFQALYGGLRVVPEWRGADEVGTEKTEGTEVVADGTHGSGPRQGSDRICFSRARMY